jgi:hypothetical protein
LKLVAPDSAVDLIRERGGRLYVWKQRTRCCGGATVTLEAATEAPAAIDFTRVENEADFELYLPTALGDLPDELHVEARRFPRRIEAYWNGCAWIA